MVAKPSTIYVEVHNRKHFISCCYIMYY